MSSVVVIALKDCDFCSIGLLDEKSTGPIGFVLEDVCCAQYEERRDRYDSKPEDVVKMLRFSPGCCVANKALFPLFNVLWMRDAMPIEEEAYNSFIKEFDDEV